jgi:putative ABC transport system permease protein
MPQDRRWRTCHADAPAGKTPLPFPASSLGAPVRRAMPMVTKLAYRNLLHDRLSLIVTLVGIVFSVVLVAVQFGIYLGSENRIAAMLDHAEGDLWVIPVGTKSFDDPTLPPGHEKHAILSTPGVASIEELAVGFINWRKASGGMTAVLRVGSDMPTTRALPRDIVEGSVAALSAPSGVERFAP